MRESILDRLLIEKSLSIVNESDYSSSVDAHIEALTPSLKNVCAKVHPDLSDRIDKIVNVLGISKRSFLEVAYIEACDRGEKIMKDEGVYDYFEKQCEFEMPEVL